MKVISLLARALIESGIAVTVIWAAVCEAHLRESQEHLVELCERYPELRADVLALEPASEVRTLVEGCERSLAEVLTEDGGAALAPERVRSILVRVCESLASLHAGGAVHGDVKPDAILLSGSSPHWMFLRLLESDVGSKLRENPGLILGSPPYMSPEQFAGRPLDARSDLYSLGIVAYQMLTGAMPFQATSAWEWATQKLMSDPAPMPTHDAEIPDRIAQAVMRVLSREPEQRFATAREFANAL